MKEVRRISQRTTVITAVAVLLAGTATQVAAQSTGSSTGNGVVSLPEPESAEPGLGSVTDGSVTIGVPVASPIHGTNVRAAGGPGTGTQDEICMASSGSSIVIVFNGGPNGSGYVTSVDGGVTFSAMASPPSPAGSNPCCDPGVVADRLGRFYFTQLYRNDGSGNCTNSLHVSTDGGQTFSNIVGSPFSYASLTTDFPDMPHIGIDPINTVGGNPQLYVFTRHFTSGINCPATGGSGNLQGEVVCSTDGGVNWTAPSVLAPFTDLAHWATGSDGSVYLVGNSRTAAAAGTCQGNGVCSNGQYGNCNGNDANCNLTSILLRRSTNDCNAGLSLGAPVTVATNLTISASAGIDREFPQPYVVTDKMDPDIAYVVWSSDRIAGQQDRDIFLARCAFTGVNGTCDGPVRINDNTVADGTAQYFPMMCMDPNNVINISWNDQRAGANSTAIMHTEVTTTGASLGMGPSYLTSEVNFTPVNFTGSPDYGDYNENSDACDATHFYAAWTSHISPPGITPASNDPDIFFAVINNIQDIRVGAPLDMEACPGESVVQELQIFNVGDAPLTINNVSKIAGSAAITVETDPIPPLVVGPYGHINFFVRCEPSGFGTHTATIRIDSDDAEQPQLDLTATCEAPAPVIGTVIADQGSFGNVCAGYFKDLDLTIANSGGCPLTVSGVVSSDVVAPIEFQPPSVMSFPLVIGAMDSLPVPVRFMPFVDPILLNYGARAGSFTINSDDPVTPAKVVDVSGNVPPGDIRVTGSTDFGEVCFEDLDQAEKTISICNVGLCTLTVDVADPGCPDFELVNNPFTAWVSPDFCIDLTIRFTPTSCDDAKECELIIVSDDPDHPVGDPLVVVLTGSTPCPSIDVPPDQAFPATVIQSVDACESLEPFPVSNNGVCNLEITDLSITTNAQEYSLSGLPSFPIILQTGHIAGEGDLNTVFAPDVLDRYRLGEVIVEYVSDPITGATATEVRNLCGESVRTGARVLVTQAGVPLPNVSQIKLLRINANHNGPRLDTVDNARNMPLVTVPPNLPCPSFQYHREYGTVSNPVQLLPGSYRVTVRTRINGSMRKLNVGFDVSSCDFNPTVVVDFTP